MRSLGEQPPLAARTSSRGLSSASGTPIRWREVPRDSAPSCWRSNDQRSRAADGTKSVDYLDTRRLAVAPFKWDASIRSATLLRDEHDPTA
ncbi:MAG: hypothetical protein R6U98_33030 [Pirellulaceae bacterium]